ncbi:MAG: hypothetical protein JXR70_10805 [Spirochaetales bacterium]|nr:hypothetical protein [Spirochaetales bacterium]
MMSRIDFEYTITPAWEVVKTVDKKIKEIFTPNNDELLTATSMVVSELIENAVKYGEENGECRSIDFKFHTESHRIIIQVTNPVRAKDKLDIFKRHIREIEESTNPLELYTRRLQELMENPGIKKTQLGLYRIAYEGQFKLSYMLKDNILTVEAVRDIL